jgi:uncharacterized protein
VITVGRMSDDRVNEHGMNDGQAGAIRDRLRAGLTAAMKERDMPAVRAIRSAMGAIDNAEAVDTTVSADLIDATSTIAGAVAGAGSTEVRRRTLGDVEITAVLRAEIDDRLSAADEYRTAGALDRADLLSAEAGVIGRFIESAGA